MENFQTPRLLSPKMCSGHFAKNLLRSVCFVYLVLVLCPIRYWAVTGDLDNTWFFALNYAAAHHLLMGRDIVWTSGPLSYLALPQDIGNNLAQGLAFQTALWSVLIVILWDVFFRCGFPLKNLLVFSIFLGLSGPLYFSPPNPLGAAETLLAGALMLLVCFRLRGGMGRYLAALILMGLIPLIEFVGAMVVVGIVAGLVVERFVHLGRRAWRDVLLAVGVPVLVAGLTCGLAVRSLHALATYLQASLELSRGYALAMSAWAPGRELAAGAEALALLGIALALVAARDLRIAVFFGLLLAGPVLVSMKHGFVRQDTHIIYFFCCVAIALGLLALSASLDGPPATALFAVLGLFFILWQDYVGGRIGLGRAIAEATGSRTPLLVYRALRVDHLKQMLRAEAERSFSADLRIEPEIRSVVLHEPVGSLSMRYGNALIDDLNLVLCPVLQRYSAYTPYLDELDADWIRKKGPRFLIFDGQTIDGRHPWTETPAMWMETYRWYNTRVLATHHLLLERRREPRFSGFERLGNWRVRFGDELRFPKSEQPIFWSMHCSLNRRGKLGSELLLGNYLPADLAEFATVFGTDESHTFSVEKLQLGGPGRFVYQPDCELALFAPLR